LGRLSWRLADVVEVRPETGRVVTLALAVPGWDGHRPGQHVDVRLTAEDGYQAERAYSIASAPDGSRVELAVERLEDGEVSPYLAGELRKGDQLELRGPVGGYFVWEPDRGGPLLLVGGGSGVVPLMAMLRLARQRGESDRVHLVASVRSPDDLYYAKELPGPETTVVYTRRTPPGATRPPGRLTADDLPRNLDPAVTTYVCGSSGFANHATDLLMDAGIPADGIRVERFGPTS